MSPRIAEDLETKYILSIGRLCNGTGPLVNIKTRQRCPMNDPEIRLRNSGEKHSSKRPEVRAKISRSKIGKPRSTDSRINQSNTLIRNYENGAKPPMEGKFHSIETRNKMSEKRIGENNSNFGKGQKYWINNGERAVMINFRMDFPIGWECGMLRNKLKNKYENSIIDFTTFDKSKENFITFFKRNLIEKWGFRFLNLNIERNEPKENHPTQKRSNFSSQI